MTAPTDDRALVDAARNGDRAALDRLLHQHYDRVLAVCRRITGNDADAADAAQEALIAMVRGIARFDGRSAFSTWAYRIATNASLDELRRRKRRPLPGLDGGEDADGTIRPEPVDLASHLPIDAVADRAALEAALVELPHDFRIAVVLRDVADLDYAEIAEVLGVPVGTVKSRIARGRAVLAGVYHRQTDLPDTGNHSDPDDRHTDAR